MATLRLIALAWTLTIFFSSIYAQCYYPDGVTLAPDQPCNSSGSVSTCCGSSAQCLDNGLCFGRGAVSRGSCTDKNWGPGMTLTSEPCTPIRCMLTDLALGTAGCPAYCQTSKRIHD